MSLGQSIRSLGDASKAIALNDNVYQIRLLEKSQKVQLLGYILNNLGYYFDTVDDYDTAL